LLLLLLLLLVLLQSKGDAAILALSVLVMPAACYLAIHASVLTHWMHFWSLLILGSAPLLYICAIPHGLWWVPMSPRLITGLSRLLMMVAAFGLLAGEHVAFERGGDAACASPLSEPGLSWLASRLQAL
jgi:hypothetical protein